MSNHSVVYGKKKGTFVFNKKALEATRNLQLDKKNLKNLYLNMRKDRFAKELQKRINF